MRGIFDDVLGDVNAPNAPDTLAFNQPGAAVAADGNEVVNGPPAHRGVTVRIVG